MKGSDAKGGFQGIGARFAEHISHQTEICRRLEEIADSLPASVEAHDCMLLARSIVPVLRRAHRFEEEVFFPAILHAADHQSGLRTTLDRLRFEHLEDEDHADELSDALVQFLRNPGDCNIDCLAYMLRGFFEGLRRHLAFDREYLLPLLEKQT